MGKIAILDEATINKIAAGEVVDRPASIVKELVENSIDAGATSISVEIKNGGISYINITDNGHGIAKDDIALAFERHATSKIRKEVDILNIRSMGFRGEALASVASIAKVTLKTKTKNEYTGTKYVIEGGIEKEFDEIAWNEGTSITVENVFFNVPARFKFLKKDATEAGYIEDVITRIALSHPDVSFKFISNGKRVINTIGNGDISAAIYSIFGKEISQELQQVSYEQDGIGVTGVIGSPKISRSTRQYEFTYINTRFIKDKTVTSAIEKAFDQNLNIGKFPFVVINIEIQPNQVDVNVHPAKLEVKFENENKVFEAVYYAVKNAILEYHRKNSPFVNQEQDIIEEKEIVETVHISEEKTIPIVDNTNTEVQKVTTFSPIYYTAQESEIEIKDLVSEKISQTLEENEYTKEEIKKEIEAYETKVKYKYVGCVFDTYILIQINDKMYIIDQHAAHERLLYEQIKERYYSKEKQTQMLLIPTIVELKNSEKELMQQNIDMFEKAGFVIEDFGDNAIKISGAPNVGFNMNFEEMFKDILDELSGSSKTTTEEKEKRFVYTMACKAAVKANMKLTEQEHIALLDDMMKLDRPFTCPHGRPTAYEISKYEIERRFARK
ncbi:MAG: DNA mismatch repair endonuclease MutL [Clostridia bacterium]|nr:DNA mismatch repair endonuclease MutL [Clostridia bacterium]